MGMKECKTKEDFETALKDAGDKLVVVDFYADWCGPCRMIAPKIIAMSEELSDVVFLKVNVDECEEVAEAHQVQAMPTFKFFKNGKEVEKDVVGANEVKIREIVTRYSTCSGQQKAQ